MADDNVGDRKKTIATATQANVSATLAQVESVLLVVPGHRRALIKRQP